MTNRWQAQAIYPLQWPWLTKNYRTEIDLIRRRRILSFIRGAKTLCTVYSKDKEFLSQRDRKRFFSQLQCNILNPRQELNQLHPISSPSSFKSILYIISRQLSRLRHYGSIASVVFYIIYCKQRQPNLYYKLLRMCWKILSENISLENATNVKCNTLQSKATISFQVKVTYFSRIAFFYEKSLLFPGLNKD